jgi:hypothetical protein
MKVEILTLCDYATTDPTGKLHIFGSFDHVFAAQEPIVHLNCALAAKIRFESGEEGTKRIAFSFIDADGQSVIPNLNAPVQVQFQPNEPTTTAPFSVIIQQMRLPHFGEYSVGIAIDGRLEATIPLYVRRTPPMTGTPLPQQAAS